MKEGFALSFPRTLTPEEIKTMEERASRMAFEMAVMAMCSTTGFPKEACHIWAAFVARERPHTPLGRTVRERDVL
jgi:hypothetical protein